MSKVSPEKLLHHILLPAGATVTVGMFGDTALDLTADQAAELFSKIAEKFRENSIFLGNFDDSIIFYLTSISINTSTTDTITKKYYNKSKNGHITYVPDNDELFESFWREYPRKDSKERARKSWQKLTVVERKLAFERLPNYIAFKETSKESWAMCSTWLNQKRWQDEYPTQKKSSHPVDTGRMVL